MTPPGKRRHVRINLSVLSSFGEDGALLLNAFWCVFGELMSPESRVAAVRSWARACKYFGHALIPTLQEAFIAIPRFAAGLAEHGGTQWCDPSDHSRRTPQCRTSARMNVRIVLQILSQATLLRFGADSIELTSWQRAEDSITKGGLAYCGRPILPKANGLSDDIYQKILQKSAAEVKRVIAEHTPGQIITGRNLIPFIVQIAAMSGANPESLLAFSRNCQNRPPIFRETHVDVRWIKNRGKAGTKHLIVPKHVKSGLSLPQLIDFVITLTAPLVPLVRERERNDLWLYARPLQDGNSRSWIFSSIVSASRRILTYAEEPFRGGISVSELAREVGCNRDHLRIRFRSFVESFSDRLKAGNCKSISTWLTEQEAALAQRCKNYVYISGANRPTASLRYHLKEWCRDNDLPVFQLASIRPSAATLLLRQGKTLFHIQSFLHHDSPAMTACYVQKELLRPTFRQAIAATQQAIVSSCQPRVVTSYRQEAAQTAAVEGSDPEIFLSANNDMGTCGCTNPLDSPVQEQKGKPCRAFNACYFCPHSVWFLDHLPLEMAKLHRFESLKKQEPFWEQKYGAICRVIRESILSEFSAEQIAWASGVAAGANGLPVLAADGRMI